MAGRTGGNITKRCYGDHFGGAASDQGGNKKNGEDEYAKRLTNTSKKCSSSLMQETLGLSVFHSGNTGEQFLRHANGLGNLADAGASIPLERDDDEFVRLNLSLIVIFNRAGYRFVECFNKDQRAKNHCRADRRAKTDSRRDVKPALLKTDANACHPITASENIKDKCADKKLT
jgi:hypothetical protein